MVRKINYKFVIELDGKEQCSTILSTDAVGAVFSELSEVGANDALYKLIAQHPSASVRQLLAMREDLSQEVFDILATDTDRSVLWCLAFSDNLAKYATQELLIKLIHLDVEIAERVAGNFDRIEQADPNELVKILIAHPDPQIALSLAENSGLHKKVHKLLLKHPDPLVAQKANESLKN